MKIGSIQYNYGIVGNSNYNRSQQKSNNIPTPSIKPQTIPSISFGSAEKIIEKVKLTDLISEFETSKYIKKQIKYVKQLLGNTKYVNKTDIKIFPDNNLTNLISKDSQGNRLNGTFLERVTKSELIRLYNFENGKELSCISFRPNKPEVKQIKFLDNSTKLEKTYDVDTEVKKTKISRSREFTLDLVEQDKNTKSYTLQTKNSSPVTVEEYITTNDGKQIKVTKLVAGNKFLSLTTEGHLKGAISPALNTNEQISTFTNHTLTDENSAIPKTSKSIRSYICRTDLGKIKLQKTITYKTDLASKDTPQPKKFTKSFADNPMGKKLKTPQTPQTNPDGIISSKGPFENINEEIEKTKKKSKELEVNIKELDSDYGFFIKQVSTINNILKNFNV